MENDPKNLSDDMKAGLGFLAIAGSLADLANRLDASRKNGEPVDVFAAFNEAMDKIKYPQDDVLNDSVISPAPSPKQT